MQKCVRVLTTGLATILFSFTASLAHAQATRTWVSGVGNDADPCSRTAPCKTFAGAIIKTATGGYINAIDSGGFGAVTITKSITIDGEGVHAGILASLTKGIIVNQSTAIVHLRNLSLESPVVPGVNPGTDGIDVIAASQVHIEHCVISGFTNTAINFHPAGGSLIVNDLTITSNTNNGIIVATGRATIENLHANGNGSGVIVNGNAIATVRNSYAAQNATAFAAIVNAAAVINLENCVITNNTTGVSAANGATARLSNTTVVSNSTNGLQNDGISNLVSLSGNALIGNPVSSPFTATFLKQ